MKLRNKKTGQEGNFIINKDHFECVGLENVPLYYSLSELQGEWEDYKPAEPLIKDEKVRKAVKAWAEANGYPAVKIGCDMASEPNYGRVQIHFEWDDIVDEHKYGVHTIAELCGEEKDD